jgi:3-dehydro-4-phosphotetronate decarboxylase
MNPTDARTQLQAAGRYMIEHGLTWGNAGNISARIAPNQALITASSTRLGELQDDDLVAFGFSNEEEPNVGASLVPARSTRKPSKEVPMHRAVYEARPDINAVLHGAPFYSTLVACTAITIPADWFVEAMYYLERIARVPYHHPGSEELGDAVRAQAAKANVDNHGVLVYDTNVQEALMALHTLELTCQMLVTARAANLPIQPLAPNTVTDFLERSGYRPRRQWPR